MADPGTATFETTTWARRVLALVVDWIACTLVVVPFVGGFDDYYGGGSQNASLYVLGVFVVESALLTAAVGGSFGQIATRLRVVQADGDPSPPHLLKALARQIMVAVVIPPLIFRPDGRGLHDVSAGTATVDLQTYLALQQARSRKAR